MIDWLLLQSFHANCVIIGDAGVLIRGESGSGKTTLTRNLVALAQKIGHFGQLVGDDRIGIRAIGNRLVAHVHPMIAGKIELRGLGIADLKFEEQAVIRLLVDCEPVLKNRVPDPSEDIIDLLGVSCRRITVTPEGSDNVFAALGIGYEII